MNLTRADERPLEAHGDALPLPGSVSDWQADRLAKSLSRIEEIFTAALNEQHRRTPSTGEGLLQVQATISDLALAAKKDPAVRHDVLEVSENFIDKVDKVNLGKVIAEGTDTAMLGAAIAYLAHTEFAASTFYGISQDACHSEAKLEQMCERAHALVKAGYIGERELEGVQVSVADTHSVKARAAEVFARLATTNGLGLPTRTEPDQSFFKDDDAKLPASQQTTPGQHSPPTINISVDESAHWGGSGGAFSHELGHWLARDKSPELLTAGVAAVKAAGGAEAAHVEQFIKPADMTAKNLDYTATAKGGILTQELRLDSSDKGVVSVSWYKSIKEMQGDLMAVATENAMYGKEAAIHRAETAAAFRDKERLTHLESGSELLVRGKDANTWRFSEEHHTSAALRDFAEKVRSGELDKVHTPAQLDKLMGESLVRGLVDEYTQVRSAELNIQHVENGQIMPGPPAGVDLKSVLVAEMSNTLHHAHGQPTVLLTEEQTHSLPANAKPLALDIPGQGPDSASTRMYLSTVAPEGMAMRQLSTELQNVAGFKISESMAPYAKDVAERAGMSLDRQGPEAVKTSALDNAVDQPVGGSIGGKISSQESSPQKSAEPAPAADMSR